MRPTHIVAMHVTRAEYVRARSERTALPTLCGALVVPKPTREETMHMLVDAGACRCCLRQAALFLRKERG